MFPSRSHHLAPGHPAPDFTARDVLGKKVTLSKIDSRYVLLVFLRYSGCPWCNLAIHRLSLEYPRLKEHDCEVVAFIQSAKSDIVDNIYERHAVKPGFSIIADPEQKFYKQYRVSSSRMAAVKSITKIPDWVHAVKKHGFKQGKIDGELFLVPALFLVDGRSQQISKAHYGSSFYDADSFLDIYQSVYFSEL